MTYLLFFLAMVFAMNALALVRGYNRQKYLVKRVRDAAAIVANYSVDEADLVLSWLDEDDVELLGDDNY